MSKTRVASRLHRDKMFERNARINIKTVSAHEKLERDLKKLGVEINPSFNVEPPLGRDPTRFRNRSG